MRRLRLLAWALAALLPAGAAGAGLELSGILGQSEPAGKEPLPFIGTTGAVADGQGRLWTAAGTQLLAFAAGPAGKWACVARKGLPSGVSSLGLRWDGQRIYLACSDGTLSALAPGGKPAPVGGIRLEQGVRSFAVAPLGLRRGFAARGKVFLLRDEGAEALSAAGVPAGTVLRLSRPAGAQWRYCSLGVEPSTGDLLVGSEWPDSRVYRYGPEGRQVTAEGWPRAGHASQILALGTQAWMLDLGGIARPLPIRQARQDAEPSFGGLGSMYPSGLARDAAGGFWLASSQGLVAFDRRGRPTGQRLGGITGVRSLGLATDGTVVAAIEDGQRMLRLGLDDDPDAPFACNANEPWRLAAGWSNKACALAWDAGRFAVLDATARQLWHFDPWHTGWRETPWLKLTEPGSLSAPRGLAAGDTLLWVLDGERILELHHGSLDVATEARLPDFTDAGRVVALAAIEDELLLVAWPDRVRAYRRSPDGSYEAAWQSDAFGRIAGIAATEQRVVAADQGARSVVALDAGTGREVGRLAASQVPGGMAPGPIAAQGAWVVVADEPGKRLLRLRLTGGPGR